MQTAQELKANQIDLLGIHGIFITANVPNDNDDLFLTEDVMHSLGSIVHKPVDWKHSQSEMIGVMTEVGIENQSGESIAKLTDSHKSIASVDLPDIFHITWGGVVWQWIFPKRAEEIMDASSNEDCTCSMECYFKRFDYAIEEGESFRIVERNKSTAVLDNQLRVNKGSGNYNGNRIYRCIRKPVFGAVGILIGNVQANPASVIREVD